MNRDKQETKKLEWETGEETRLVEENDFSDATVDELLSDSAGDSDTEVKSTDVEIDDNLSESPEDEESEEENGSNREKREHKRKRRKKKRYLLKFCILAVLVVAVYFFLQLLIVPFL